MDIGTTVEVPNPEAFAALLASAGADVNELWTVIYKKASGRQTVSFEALLDVALCFGWIDGFTKSIDAERYVIRFTPRGKKSTWSDLNRAAARRLVAAGRMTPAGLAVLPPDLLPATDDEKA